MGRKKNTRRSSRPRDNDADLAAAPENPYASVQQTTIGGFQSLLVVLSIALGIFSFFMILDGDVDGPQLVPHLLCSVGAVCGAGFFVSKPYPKLRRTFQIAAAALSTLGIAGLAMTSGAG